MFQYWYEVAPVNGLIKLTFVTLGKDQFKVMVKVEDEKQIYVSPDKHSMI